MTAPDALALSARLDRLDLQQLHALAVYQAFEGDEARAVLARSLGEIEGRPWWPVLVRSLEPGDVVLVPGGTPAVFRGAVPSGGGACEVFCDGGIAFPVRAGGEVRRVRRAGDS